MSSAAELHAAGNPSRAGVLPVAGVPQPGLALARRWTQRESPSVHARALPREKSALSEWDGVRAPRRVAKHQVSEEPQAAGPSGRPLAASRGSGGGASLGSALSLTLSQGWVCGWGQRCWWPEGHREAGPATRAALRQRGSRGVLVTFRRESTGQGLEPASGGGFWR